MLTAAAPTWLSSSSTNHPLHQPPTLPPHRPTPQDDYDLGNLYFDPLGLKPSDPEELKVLETKELNNGRLAMIAIAGFTAQELVNNREIFEHLFLNIEKEILSEEVLVEKEVGVL